MRVLPLAVTGLVLLSVSQARAAFPGANGLLAVQPRTGGGILLVGADGRGARRICTDHARCGVPRRPRWSPDGRALVFAGPAIKIVAADGSCMNCQFGAAPNPAFEPGATLISFIQRGQTTIDAIDGIRQDFQVPATASDAVWSGGGKLALVHNGAIWAGRRAFPERIADGSEPSWSPSGDAVAAAQRGWVVVMRLRDHRVRRLVRGSAPAFSPDGRLIAYVAPDDRLMVVSASGRSAPRHVGNIRALSVDWQPRTRGPNPGCVAPRGSKVVAGSSEAVVTVDGAPGGAEFPSPPVAYMGCLRADGRERLLDRIADEGSYGRTKVDSVAFAVPYVGLAVTSMDTHYGNGGTTVQVFDLRRGLLTKLGGESFTCYDYCPDSGLDRVVLGPDGVSAAHIQTIDPVGSLSTSILDVSCTPGGSACVAVDQTGHLLSTTDPAGGRQEWTSHPLSGGGSAVACPSPSLCVAVGGGVSTTTNPGGGAQAWTSVPLPVKDRFADAVACPSTTLCVASHVDGIVLTSTDPTGGTSAWSPAQIDSGALGAVFCSTLPVCFITDSADHVLTSSNPTGGVGAWAASTGTPPFVSGTCPTSTLCVAVNGTRIISSTDQAGAAWTQTTVADNLDAVACPSASLCLAVGSNGALDVSTNPAGGVWTRTAIDQGRPLTSISCASATLCVATDWTGHVVTSTDPTAGPSAWTPALVDGDPCADTTPCSEESIQVSDFSGVHTVDTSKLSGAGPFLTSMTLTGDTLSWSHAGTQQSVALVRPR